MLTVFIYAKLWHRSNVLTDIEFYELRYSGKAAAFLRGFRALYLGLVFNVLVMGAVSLAAVKFGEIVLGIPGWLTLIIACSITLIYSVLGGLKAVIVTDFIQFIFAIGILKVPFVASIFNQISKGFVKVISFTQAGTDFLFASFITGKIEAPMVNFMVQVLPTIIFFSALTSILYYYKIIQRVVRVFAWMLTKLLNISGQESLAVTGNIFLGQTEAPLLVKGYLDKMNRSRGKETCRLT